MVLESLVKIQGAQEHPARMFFLGAFYALLSIAIAWWIFRSHAGLVSVFFCVIFLIPLYYETLLREEHAEIHAPSERRLLFSHAQALGYLTWIFMGMTAAFSLSYMIMPEYYISDSFGIQLSTITEFNSELALQVSGAAVSTAVFTAVLLNNLKVLALSFFLSFLSGAGVLFVISWNASVIGVALGAYIIEQAASINGPAAIAPALGLIRYALHAVPEVAAYLVGGIAGGLLSLALIHHSVEHADTRTLVADTFNLILVSVAIIFVSGVIEVYAVPALLGGI